jgi:hypothetical protein
MTLPVAVVMPLHRFTHRPVVPGHPSTDAVLPAKVILQLPRPALRLDLLHLRAHAHERHHAERRRHEERGEVNHHGEERRGEDEQQQPCQNRMVP